MIKVALVDDHAILRKSLAVLIGMLQDFVIVIEAGNGEEFIKQLQVKEKPDIVLLDITMPVMDGVETARWIKENQPDIKVVALSMLNNDLIIIRMLKNGARGYLLKDSEPAELKSALLQVYTKGYYYNEYILPKMTSYQTKEIPIKSSTTISENELVFLKWVCTELSYKEIANEMCLSPRTIDGYRDSLFQKLQVGTRVGLAIYAIKHKIVVI